jgi:general secretion pathway protein H
MRTPTSRTSNADSLRQAGFTLVELLAVLAILALAAAAFSSRSTGGLETANFRAFMIRTSAAMSEGRIDAVRQSEEKVFIIDLKSRRLAYPAGDKFLALPNGVDLTASVAASERYENGTVGIRFYPTGASSGGTLAFKFRGKSYEIRVNWLTGNVSLDRA